MSDYTITEDDLKAVERMAKEMGIKLPNSADLDGTKSLKELADEGKYSEFEPSPPVGDPNLGRSDKYGPIDPKGPTAQTDWEPENAAITKPKKRMDVVKKAAEEELEKHRPTATIEAEPKERPRRSAGVLVEPKTTTRVVGGNLITTTVNADKETEEKAKDTMMDIWLKEQKEKGKDTLATRFVEARKKDSEIRAENSTPSPGKVEVDEGDKGKTFSRENIEGRTKNDIQILLRGADLKVSGKKAELVTRLLDFYEKDTIEKEKDWTCEHCGRGPGDLYGTHREHDWTTGCVCQEPEPEAEPEPPAEEDEDSNCLHPQDARIQELVGIFFCGRCRTRVMEEN